jgi:hypothetical protein
VNVVRFIDRFDIPTRIGSMTPNSRSPRLCHRLTRRYQVGGPAELVETACYSTNVDVLVRTTVGVAGCDRRTVGRAGRVKACSLGAGTPEQIVPPIVV